MSAPGLPVRYRTLDPTEVLPVKAEQVPLFYPWYLNMNKNEGVYTVHTQKMSNFTVNMYLLCNAPCFKFSLFPYYRDLKG